MPGLSYQQSGVNYDRLDAFKRACQRSAATTTSMLALHGMSEPKDIRGESAYLVEMPDRYLAHVEEGLGTKNLVADAMLNVTGESFYRNVGIDTVATIVNDLITTGALPISVAMHAAVGDAEWFSDPRRSEQLAEGFAEGCLQSQAVWGGGETPTLRGIVNESTIVLAGSAIGQIAPKSRRLTGEIQDGDAIVLFASSGVHTNGLTLCRQIADRLPQGYQTVLDDGRTYGQSLLDPSVIYVKLIANLQKAGVQPRYAVHITGHGWRKLMRPPEAFVYRIHTLPARVPPVFDFIVKSGPIEIREAYATFNMGAGFALYVDPKDAQWCVEIGNSGGYTAWVAGSVHRESGRKAVEIKPLNITFESDTLQVR